MPSEITDVDKFVAMSAKAKYCSVKRLKDTVKLKLRTPGQLFTLKIEPITSRRNYKEIAVRNSRERKRISLS